MKTPQLSSSQKNRDLFIFYFLIAMAFVVTFAVCMSLQRCQIFDTFCDNPSGNADPSQVLRAETPRGPTVPKFGIFP